MNISIRRATIEHIPGIYALVEQLAIYEKARHEMTLTLDDYLQLFKSGNYQSIVALAHDAVIGTCIFYDTFSTWKGRMLYLEDFVVDEQYRNSGVGQQLYDHLINFAKKEKYALVKWQVLDWNEPAINFYKKNNAIIDKEWWNCKVVF